MKSLWIMWQTKLAIFIFLVFTVFWVYITVSLPRVSIVYQIFSATYGIMALFGACFGFFIANRWGGIKSVMGRSLFFFSLGLFAQEFGQLAYSYYQYFEHVQIPYPSMGDIGYFGSIFCYILALLYLAKATGSSIKLKLVRHQLVAIIVPLCMLAVAYLLFLQNYQFDWSHPLTVFLDFGYPFGQAIYISLALLIYLLSRGMLGGFMKPKVMFILFALIVQFISDYTFLYLSKISADYPGSYNDYMYLIAYFIMTIALLQVYTVYLKFKTT